MILKMWGFLCHVLGSSCMPLSHNYASLEVDDVNCCTRDVINNEQAALEFCDKNKVIILRLLGFSNDATFEKL